MVSADKILSESQLTRFLKTLKNEKDKSLLTLQDSSRHSRKEVRVVLDYYLFHLISWTGLRISEALNLMWSDIHEDFLIVRPEVSKNKKKGTVYFGIKTKRLLDELKLTKQFLLKNIEVNFLFSLNGKIPSRCYQHRRFKYWLNQTGLPSNLSIHSLRHTYGTQCLDKGLSIVFVRDNLRHSSLSVTELT